MTTRAAARALREENSIGLRSKRDASPAAPADVPAKRQRKALGNITNKNGQAKARSGKATTGRRKSARSSSTAAAEPSTKDVLALVPKVIDLETDEPLPPHVRDIDAGEEEDPTLVAVYTRSVYRHLLEVEQKYRADPSYMDTQKDINANMRGILVDWLVEVAEEYKLHTETLFLSVNYIDRYLSRNDVVRGKLQLVGITAMLCASKYEEIYPPSVEDFVYISDNAYTREQVIEKEVAVLNSLSFHCTVATSRQFLRRFAKAARADHRTHEMSHYLAELSLLDIDFLHHTPSEIAASALLISICTTNLFGPGHLNWDATMQYYSTYSFDDLKKCADKLLQKAKNSFNQTEQFRAVREKYMQQKFDQVALIKPCVALSP